MTRFFLLLNAFVVLLCSCSCTRVAKVQNEITKEFEIYEYNPITKKKNGYYVAILGNDTVVKTYYINGRESGMSIGYYPKNIIRREMMIVNDTLHGLYREYHRNGIIKFEAQYSKNRIMSVLTCRDSTGRDLPCGNLENGNGYMCYFEDNGNRDDCGMYKNGLREGWWVFYDEQNNIQDSLFYIADEPVVSDPFNIGR